ncbi:hypothetical protein DVA67_005175 [Solirubrobacter sp. CPCC 204708]|uniref:Glycosyltransferase RgtA/B/C/D-like domain-containing protein n=1 Tax=Solirubrobacter deserti TaxID=2282478 RepID=A0ABT4RGX5_9ACTN|nr:hypothetical protein [Solirubrobacter deserti]MBE2315356.1 hypothetical protein [Solirubrobacter deserti]MDA0137799.1 hypothetical protein [Solirubrobacter deserti]
MSTIPWLIPLAPSRRFALSAPACALALVTAAGLAVFLAYPTYPAYDSLYALLWARELLDGTTPGFDGYRTPTQHPLLLPVGLLLVPFGDAGARLFIALCFAGLVALVAAVYRLGKLAAGPVGGFVAAGLLLSRFNFGLLASKGYLDVPYCAFVAWAMALEAERPRRGGAVWWLLGLAGLLRPEAWLLAGLYGLWIGRGGLIRRAQAALPALAAPAIWMALDLAVTGDPLFSIRHTDALAAELQREIPLGEIPHMTLFLLTEILKLPVLLLAGIGVVLALRARAVPLAVPAAVALVTLASYLVIATGGLAGVYRYLLLTGIGGVLFAAFALAGWARLPASRMRTVWMSVAIFAAVVGGAYTAARLSGPGLVRALNERPELRAELHGLLARPEVAAAAACGPITVPNHKLLPEIRWALDAPASGVRARSDRTFDATGPGLALAVRPPHDESAALNVYEVPADGTAIAAAPAGHALIARTERFEAWGRC